MEYEVGEKSFIEMLDAQQKLFDAQVNLAKARKAVVDNSYLIKVSMGECTAAMLKLPVANYDVQGNYEKTRGRLFGTSLN